MNGPVWHSLCRPFFCLCSADTRVFADGFLGVDLVVQHLRAWATICIDLPTARLFNPSRSRVIVIISDDDKSTTFIHAEAEDVRFQFGQQNFIHLFSFITVLRLADVRTSCLPRHRKKFIDTPERTQLNRCGRNLDSGIRVFDWRLRKRYQS